MFNPSSKVIGLRPIHTPETVVNEENKAYEDKLLQVREAQQELQETKQRTQDLIAETRKQIQEEKEAWEEEKKKWVEQAKEEGYQTGFEQGKEESLLNYQSLIKEAKKVIDITRDERTEMITQNERFILNISLEAATKIIHQSLVDKEAYIEIVKDVLQEAREQPTIQIHAHPNDYLICQKYKDELFAIVDEKVELSFYPDDALEKGSCIMESPLGKIDASIDTQLENLRDQLHSLLEEMDCES
ncbi:flagellar assembly protein FliH [Paraliobacillus sp. PM-2]|uniref:flagellar assembly protein FliH n=1 Tax=Paraliobacillus sp. PM-2 TaxID=1462524 RepID=UPI00159EE533|nr:flagellar assembly protein FliH [Paraliobacillus sp. PM-2]